MRSMKKKILLTILLCFSCTSVYAVTNQFEIDSSKFSFSSNSKKNKVTSEFDKNYNLTTNISESNDKLRSEITSLSKKVTYLLLGQNDISKETAKEYYSRRQDYLNLRYNPKIPKDSTTFTGLDENSQEYKDDLVSGMSVPGMFNILNELEITYNTIDSIRVSLNKDMVISMVFLKDITMKEEDSNNPMKYKNTKTNLVLYYYFKKLDNDYKLYYLFAETKDDLSKYLNNVEDSESTKSMVVSEKYDSKLSDIYDFSKLQALDNNKLNQVYDSNSKNVLILNAYYSTKVVASANGFLLSDGLVITTWDFLEKALVDSQFFTIKNKDGTVYQIDGIVTANPETDIAVIKLKEKIESNTILGDTKNVNVEDPIITISSKSGVGLTLQTGIITSKDGYLQSSIPLTESDEGSPLYNENGELIGINTSKSINSSISMAVDSKILMEVKSKISNTQFDSIKTISFDELKEKYYYTSYGKEKIINSIPNSKWKEYKKIGNIEKNIKLELVKANYDNNVVSLRYYNGISKYISGMQLASAFKEELVKSSYKQTLNTNSKSIYEDNKYKVIIMDEFDYLIIVMVKL